MFLESKLNPIKWLQRLIIAVLTFFLSSVAIAADIEAVLDDTSGASAFSVKDSSSVEKAHIDSLGNIVSKGCMRLSATGTECATPLDLVVDGNIGIGTTGPQSPFTVGSIGQFQISSTGAISNSSGYTQTGNNANTFSGITTFSNATNSAFFTGGNVGVGTTTPGSMLAVNGGLAVGGVTYAVDQRAENGAIIEGNVGIGTWTPLKALDVRGSGIKIGADTFDPAHVTGTADLLVSGNLDVHGNVYLGDAITDNLTVSGTMSLAGNTDLTGNVGIGTLAVRNDTYLSTIGGNVGIGTTSADASVELVKQGSEPILMVSQTATGDGDAMIITSAGNIGINNAAPGQRLDVSGTVRATNVTSTGLLTTDGVSSSAGYTQSGSNANTLTGTSTFTAAQSIIADGNIGLGTTLATGGLSVMNGNIGIGTWVAQSSLEVLGGLSRFGSGTVNNVSGAGDVYIANNLEVDGNVWLGDAAADNLTVTGTMSLNGLTDFSGNVGIGTLEVRNDTYLSTIGGNVGIGTTSADASVELVKQGTEPILMVSQTAAGDGDAMIITSAGNMGINNATPGQRLDVTGTIRASNVTSTGLLTTAGVSSSAGYAQSGSNANTLTGTSTFTAAQSIIAEGNIGLGTTLATRGLSVMNGNIGIGTWVAQSSLEVLGGLSRFGSGTVNNVSGAGDVYIANNLEVDGSVWLGDAAADNLTVTGTMSLEGLTDFTGNVGIGTLQVRNDTYLSTVGGNVGIGTTAPKAELEITSTVANDLFRVNDNGVADETPFIVNSVGNVGIGTSESAANVSIVGSSDNPQLIVRTSAGITTNAVEFQGSDGTARLKIFDLNSSPRILFNHGAAQGGDFTSQLSGVDQLSFGFNNLAAFGGVSGNTSGRTLYFYDRVDSAFRGAINSAGDLYWGKTTSDYAVRLSAPAAASVPITVHGAAGQTANLQEWQNNSDELYMVLTAEGNLGIGSTAPSQKLDVNGDVRIGLGTFDNNSSNNDLFISGNLEVDGSVWLGDAAADNLTVTGTMSLNGLTDFSGNVGIGTLEVRNDTYLSTIGGNLGIGTTAADASVELVKQGNEPYLMLSATAAGDGNTLIVNSSGNMGVGNNTPGQKLDVTGTVRASNVTSTGLLTTAGVSSSAGYTQSGSNANTLTGTSTFTAAQSIIAEGNIGLGTTLATRGLSVMNGNIGIGTWVAQSSLEVLGGLSRFGSGTVNNVSGAGDVYIANNLEVDGNVWLGDAAADNLTVTGTMSLNGLTDFSGNVGIGTLEVRNDTYLSTIGGNVGIGSTSADASVELVKQGNEPYLMLSATAAGDGNTLIVNSSGNIGVGNNTPGQKLDVTGTIRGSNITSTGVLTTAGVTSSAGYTQSGTNINTLTGTTTFNNATNSAFFTGGNVGVGTTAPGSRLGINGGVGIGGVSYAVDYNAGNGAIIEGNVGIGTFEVTDGKLLVMGGNVGINSLTPGQRLDVAGTVRASNVTSTGTITTVGISNTAGYTQSGSTANTLTGTTTFSNPLSLVTTGNVGVGSSAPSAKLDVDGDVRVGLGTFNNNSSNNDLYVSGNIESDGSIYGAFLIGSMIPNSIEVSGYSAFNYVDGNTGIGTTTPDASLEILKQGVEPYLMLSASAEAGGDVFIINSSGNIGVGNNAPGQKLDVTGTIRGSNITSTGLLTTAGVTSSAGYTQSGSNANTLSGTTTFSAAQSIVANGNVGLGTTLATGGLSVMNGNIGIGTWTPRAGLEVGDAGTITMSNPTVQDVYIKGRLEVDGDVWLGDNASVDTLTINSQLILDGLTDFSGNVGIGTLQVRNDTYLSTVGGNVGIGTTAADASVELVKQGNEPYLMVSQTAAGNGDTLIITSAGNIGVNNTNPGQQLDVTGTIRGSNITSTGLLTTAGVTSSAGYTQSGSNANTLTGTTTFSAAQSLVATGNVGLGTTLATGGLAVMNGNVGIGTWVPGQALDVIGTIRASDVLAAGGNLTVGGTAVITGSVTAAGISNSLGYTQSGGSSANTFLGTSTFSNASSIVATGNVGLGTTLATRGLSVMNGNIGIGTWTPRAGLEVGDAGTITMSNPTVQDVYIKGRLEVDGDVWLGDNASVDTLTINSQLILDGLTDFSGNVGIGTLQVRNDTYLSTVGGNVGIGTTSATAELDITSAALNDLFRINDSGVTGDTSPFIVKSDGNVGIGTSTPQGSLVVFDGNVGIGLIAPAARLEVMMRQLGQTTIMRLFNAEGTANSTADIDYGVNNSSIVMARTGALRTNRAASGDTDYRISLYSNGVLAEKLRIQDTGNVGIGTTMTAGGFVVMNGNVGFGTWVPRASLEVLGAGGVRIGNGLIDNTQTGNGDLYVTGNLEVDGTVWLGDAGSDSLTVSGPATIVGPMTIDGLTNFSSNVGINTLEVRNDTYLSTIGGNVGIGTTAADASVELVKQGNEPYLMLSQTAAGDGNTLIVSSAGNVGIANIAPGQKLDVTGTIRGSNITSTGLLTTAGVTSSAGYTQSGSNANTLSGTTTFSAAQSIVANGNIGLGTTLATGGLSVMNGNIGIGTWTPRAGLEVGDAGTISMSSPTVQDVYIKGRLEVDGDVWLGDNASVDTLTITSQLNLSGLTDFAGNVGIGTLEVRNDTYLSTVGGNVGIGSTQAFSEFEITSTATNDLFRVNDDGVGDTSPFVIASNGNVGVGVTTPQDKFEIVFSSNTVNDRGLIVRNTLNGAGSNAIFKAMNDANTAAYFGIGSTTRGDEGYFGADKGVIIAADAAVQNGGTNGITFFSGGWDSTNRRMYIGSTGNVGIGSTTPQARLAVVGGNVGIGTWTAEGGNLIVNGGGNVGIGSAWPGQRMDVAGTVRATSFIGDGSALTGINAISGLNTGYIPKASSATAINDSGLFQSGSNIGLGTNTPQGAFVVTNGNVGIGTWAPTTALNVIGGNVGIGTSLSNFARLQINGDGATELMRINDSGQNDVTPFIIASNGNVGINTTSTSAKLTIRGGSGGVPISYINIVGVDTSDSYLSTTDFSLGRNSLTTYVDYFIRKDDGANGTGINFQSGTLDFRTSNTSRMTMTASGLGIGTTAVQTRLAVNGNVGIGTWTAAGGNLIVNGGGNVGIGSAWPGQAMDVNGTVRATAFIGDGSALTGINAISGLGTGYISKASSATAINDSGLFQSGSNIGLGTTTPQGAFVVTNGNVGIGTWAPQSNFFVAGPNVGAGTYFVINRGNLGIGTISPSNQIDIKRGLAVGEGAVKITGYFPITSEASTVYGVNLDFQTPRDISNQTVYAMNVKNNTPFVASMGAGASVGGVNVDVASSGNQGHANTYGINVTAGSNSTTIYGVKSAAGGANSVSYGVHTTTTGGLSAYGIYAGARTSGGGHTAYGGAFSIEANNSGDAYGVYSAPTGTYTYSSHFYGVYSLVSGTVTKDKLAGYFTDGTSIARLAGNAQGTASSAATFSGNVGINTTNPFGSLVVATGNVGIGTLRPQAGFVSMGNVGIGTWTAAGGNLIVNGGGNVGIGSAWPGQAMDVNGTVRATAFIGDGSGLTGISSISGLGIGYISKSASATSINDSGLFQSGSNIGLGTTTPQGAFVVTNGNVGIGTFAPRAGFDLNGTLVVTPSSATGTTVASGSSMTVTKAIMRIVSDGGIVTLANPQINTGVDGQMVTIIGTSNANAVQFTNGTGLKLTGAVSFTVGLGDIINFIYDANSTVWTETTRADN